MKDPRTDFMRLYRQEASLRAVAKLFDLSAEEMGRALHYARLSKIISNTAQRPLVVTPPPPPALKPTGDRIFCEQCDRAVYPENARNCASQWCKARDKVPA